MSREVRCGAATRRGRCEMSNTSQHHMATIAERGRHFWRCLLLAGALFATIGAVSAPVEHPRPLGLAPTSCSIQGGRLVFLDVDEGTTVRGQAKVECQFGSHAAIRAAYDGPSDRYTCRAPAHERPEAVTLPVSVDGETVTMATPFVYVTPGVESVSPVVVDVLALAKQVQRVRADLPASVRLCAVLKKGEPPAGFADVMSRAAKIDYFAVPTLEDGIALRNAGITN